MKDDLPFVILIVVMFIILISCTLLYSRVATTAQNPLSLVAYAKSSLGQRCVSEESEVDTQTSSLIFSPQICSSGLVCSKQDPRNTYGICRVTTGGTCNSVHDCEPGASSCSNRICQIGAFGTLNTGCFADGSCKYGFSCNEDGICKTAATFPGCTSSSDCDNGRCIFKGAIGYCYSNGNTGASCEVTDSNPEPCGLGICSKGFCQAANVTTGEVGSICYYGPVSADKPRCNSGLYCAYDYYKDGEAPSAGDPILGLCTSEISVYGGTCSATKACRAPSVCQNETCGMPKDSLTGYYLDSSKAGTYTSFQCEKGFFPINGICYGDSGKPCSRDLPSCLYGCRNDALINRWSYNYSNPSSQNGLGTWTPITSSYATVKTDSYLSYSPFIGSSGGVVYSPGHTLNSNGAYFQVHELQGNTTINYPVTGSFSNLISVKVSHGGLFIFHYVDGIYNNNAITRFYSMYYEEFRLFGGVVIPSGRPNLTWVDGAALNTIHSYEFTDTNLGGDYIGLMTFIITGSKYLYYYGFRYVEPQPGDPTFGSVRNQLNDLSSIANVNGGRLDMTSRGWTTVTPVVKVKYYKGTGSPEFNFFYLLNGANNITSYNGVLKHTATDRVRYPENYPYLDRYSGDGGEYIFGFDYASDMTDLPDPQKMFFACRDGVYRGDHTPIPGQITGESFVQFNGFTHPTARVGYTGTYPLAANPAGELYLISNVCS